MAVPARPKIYHIVHLDRLSSILASGGLMSDARMIQRQDSGTTIGMNHIKARRLNVLSLQCHPGLFVGQCVPFYFCSRSVMLYLIHVRNPDLAYRGGQEPIVHLEADLLDTVAWAEANDRKWAFTLSNAGARYFEDRCDLAQLGEIKWDAVSATNWSGVKEGKQAEFLLEEFFPWHLVERIGVCTQPIATHVGIALHHSDHRPAVEIKRDWYY
ncbi:DUF4433 domain-containing protein [Asticcacaulis sp.]|uniref:type II toxin-antitoxin system toxin DNA ADP-ribosyl transferase DarT n=1 Tax=Asticcacaulis sp. TaxID=1872648 RepID=UPI00263176EE|nr:DUF4433 domain-containing protein [Asticcacaulis sp.]